MKREIKSIIEDFGKKKEHNVDKSIDFDGVSEKLKKHQINLNSHSLHKLWKYLSSAEKPSRKALDRLSLFAGFQSWSDLQRAFMGE